MNIITFLLSLLFLYFRHNTNPNTCLGHFPQSIEFQRKNSIDLDDLWIRSITQESTSLLLPDPSTFTSVLRPTKVRETTGLCRDYWPESRLQNGARSGLYKHIHHQSSISYFQGVNSFFSTKDTIPESVLADKILFPEINKLKLNLFFPNEF